MNLLNFALIFYDNHLFKLGHPKYATALYLNFTQLYIYIYICINANNAVNTIYIYSTLTGSCGNLCWRAKLTPSSNMKPCLVDRQSNYTKNSKRATEFFMFESYSTRRYYYLGSLVPY